MSEGRATAARRESRRPFVSRVIIQVSQIDRGCVKTLKPLMVQCIFGHVGSISHDFVDSNRALSNLQGKWFGFSHGLGQYLPCSGERTR